MPLFNSIHDLKEICHDGKSIAEVAIAYEIELTGNSPEQVVRQMKTRITVMREGIKKGRRKLKSRSGWVGSEAWTLEHSTESPDLCGNVITHAMINALALSDVNACMGRIVAAPTAGSCGVLPGAVLAVADEFNLDEEIITDAMFVAGAIGTVIERNATFSAAEAGCQAECGTASAMAAASIAYLRQGNNDAIFNAAALALKNCLGLSCDPIGGLVEIPCVKRNAFYAAHAIIAASLALSGIKSLISFDGVIDAMMKTASNMTTALKETANGGLAITDEGRSMAAKFNRQQTHQR